MVKLKTGSGSANSTESGSGDDANSDSQSGNQTQGNEGQNQNNTNSQSGNQKENNQKYTLQAVGVLTEEKNIDWDSVKVEIENLYTSLPTITLDLYQLNVEQSDILNLNNENQGLKNI